MPAVKSLVRLAVASFLVECTGAVQRLTTKLVRVILTEELRDKKPSPVEKDHGPN